MPPQISEGLPGQGVLHDWTLSKIYSKKMSHAECVSRLNSNSYAVDVQHSEPSVMPMKRKDSGWLLQKLVQLSTVIPTGSE